MSKSALARYYLRALEKQHKGEANPELVPNPNQEEVNLEHVLPQSPGGNWPSFSDDEAKTWYRRIGNLALMKADENSGAGSDPFSAKKPILKKSKFKLTAEIGKCSDWTISEIEARQERLAKLAVKTWDLKC